MDTLLLVLELFCRVDILGDIRGDAGLCWVDRSNVFLLKKSLESLFFTLVLSLD
jgi:hypothetical protein